MKNISTGIDDATGLKLAEFAQDTNYLIAPGGTGGYYHQVPDVHRASR